MRFGFLFAALLLMPALHEGQQRQGSITGVVVDARSADPIADAQVSLIAVKLAAGREYSTTPAYQTRTDDKGRFALQNINVGRYRLTFQRNGYVRQEYGQRAPSGASTPIDLAAGQSFDGGVARMTPTASVAGRIRDLDKRPLAGVPVQLMRYKFHRNGTKELTSFGSTWTDDRGEYRLAFVTPGRYYIVAGTPPWEDEVIPDPRSRAIPERFPYTFYPGVGETAFATTVDLRSAAMVAGIDFTLSRSSEQKNIQGRITGEHGKSCSQPECSVLLMHVDRATGTEHQVNPWFSGELVVKDGVFEIQNVAPGSYNLAIHDDSIGERVRVDIVASDVSGITLPMPAPDAKPVSVSIDGRLSLDGRASSADLSALTACSIPEAFEQFHFAVFDIALYPIVSPVLFRLPGDSVQVEPNGRFRINDVMIPGEYQLVIFCPEVGYYLREARYGADDILGRTFRIDAGTQSRALDLVFSSDVSTIDGVVTDAQRRPAEASRVVLVPANRARFDLYRSIFAGADGRFTFENVPSGDYKVFAWDGLEDYGYLDSELLQQVEDRGEFVHPQRLSKQRVSVTSIPGEAYSSR